MKLLSALLIICILVGACSTPKKSAPKRKAPVVTKEDELRGGTSFSNSIVIRVQSEREVLDEEYKWLAYSYPGYALIRKSHLVRLPKHYDIVRIKTRQGQVKDIYFDCTAYWGKM